MWQTWKYTLPAFLVPFAFVLTDNGEGLLGLRSFGDMVWTAAVGRAGGGGTCRRHRRLAGPSCGLAGAVAVRACGWTAAVSEPGDDRGGGWPASCGRGGAISLSLADHQRNHSISRLPIPPIRRIDPDQPGPVAVRAHHRWRHGR